MARPAMSDYHKTFKLIFNNFSEPAMTENSTNVYFSEEITRVLCHMYKFIVGYILGGQKENLTQNKSKTYTNQMYFAPFS